ncbi:coiled-coil domain-containing protein 113-like [Sycon ciliatum]|uniref:coiled-coil domain-containing protein 113-like n=1 Tax=Sycon ciliatum TaxID=27933 RepID=UPI0031F6E399
MSNASSPMVDVPAIDFSEPPESSVTSSLTSSARFGTTPGRERDPAVNIRIDPDELSKMNVTELAATLHHYSTQTKVLMQEATIYQSYFTRLRRKDPDAFKDLPVATGGAGPGTGVDRTARQQRKKHAKGAGSESRPLRLTMEQKVDIVEKEVECAKRELAFARRDFEGQTELQLARSEDAKICLDELRKMEFDFQRDVIENGKNQFTGQIMSEKVVRYFEDKLRKRNTLIAKLQLNLTSMRQQKMKVDVQLQQKEDSGESMKAVDFEKLQIQNRDYQEQINQSVQQILKLKVVAASTVQNLQASRNDLSKVMKEADALKGSISQREEMLRKIDKELETTTRECEEAKFENLRLKKLKDDYKVPPVMDYIQTTADLYSLKKKICQWQRKIDISEMAIKTTYQKLARLRHEYSDLVRQAQPATQAQIFDRYAESFATPPMSLPPLKSIVRPSGTVDSRPLAL